MSLYAWDSTHIGYSTMAMRGSWTAGRWIAWIYIKLHDISSFVMECLLKVVSRWSCNMGYEIHVWTSRYMSLKVLRKHSGSYGTIWKKTSSQEKQTSFSKATPCSYNIELCAHRTEYNYHCSISIEIEFRLRVYIRAISPHCSSVIETEYILSMTYHL